MSYKLQEFNKDYVISGATKLDALKPIKDIPLNSDIDGTVIIDLNDDTLKNNLIPLYTVKVNNEQFQNVIDTEFTEFTVPALDRTPLLEAEIDALKFDRNRLAILYKESATLNTEQSNTIREFQTRRFSDRLYRSFGLSSNQNPTRLMSNNRQYVTIMQTDGNLVTYRTANPIGFDINSEGPLGDVVWASGTGGSKDGPFRAIYQNDTNFVIYNSKNRPIWSSFGNANVATINSVLILRDDGSLQIADESVPTDVRVFWQRP